MTELRRLMPFLLLGIDTDNDSVFINETIRDYCVNSDIEFARCRPYRKNDQAYVEQKNGSVIRRIVGYHRYEGVEAAAILAELYRSVRLFVNFFQLSFKLLEKRRNGAMLKKLYSSPATPHHRLLSDARAAVEVCNRLLRMREQFDLVKLLRDIRAGQQRFADIAHQGTPSTEAPNIESFLQSLRIAWTEAEVRPTAKAKPKLKRERRRLDPLVNVTNDLYTWFEDEPWRTGRELRERLQSIYPGEYPDGLIRTVQPRVKGWRRERAHRIIFGIEPGKAEQLPELTGGWEHSGEAICYPFGGILR
ncbi:hypothetical protein GR212_33780 [Rhizobium lusitanum]|uniref:Integrase catalytic domain-containing protein n=1 Tax=Rhizobium lusitanum TaxID=293958 RepID=A0A6L9UL10_9HYPH|nr:hypothetical protein [Rhizobium lusitanum]NEI74520.1 hypothetical protein [Rhizobium lusitanum]